MNTGTAPPKPVNWREAGQQLVKIAAIQPRDIVQHINSGQQGIVTKVEGEELYVDLGKGNSAVWSKDEVNRVNAHKNGIVPTEFTTANQKEGAAPPYHVIEVGPGGIANALTQVVAAGFKFFHEVGSKGARGFIVATKEPTSPEMAKQMFEQWKAGEVGQPGQVQPQQSQVQQQPEETYNPAKEGPNMEAPYMRGLEPESKKKNWQQKLGTEPDEDDFGDTLTELGFIGLQKYDAKDFVDIALAQLGWAVAGQLREILDGESLSKKNSNALRMIMDFAKYKGEAGLADTLFEYLHG